VAGPIGLEVLEANDGLATQRIIQLAVDFVQRQDGAPERQDPGRSRGADVEDHVSDP